MFGLGNGRKAREQADSFGDFELPTRPGSREGANIYDAELYELVGKLIGAMAVFDKRQQAMRRELKTITRKQTAIIAGILTAAQALVEVWRHVH